MANKFEKQYVLPVMANMDKATRELVWYMFFQTYGIHPDKAFRGKSHDIKMCHLEWLYFLLIQQIYSGMNEKPGIEYIEYNTADSNEASEQNTIFVKINPGMESKYTKTQREMSALELSKTARIGVHLKYMAAVCTITSNAKAPKIPRQTLDAFVRGALLELVGR